VALNFVKPGVVEHSDPYVAETPRLLQQGRGLEATQGKIEKFSEVAFKLFVSKHKHVTYRESDLKPHYGRNELFRNIALLEHGLILILIGKHVRENLLHVIYEAQSILSIIENRSAHISHMRQTLTSELLRFGAASICLKDGFEI